MIHIVFNEADVKVMEQVMALDESLAGSVIQIKDDFAVGPLHNVYLGDGIAERKEWWRMVTDGGDYHGMAEKNDIDDTKTAASLVGTMRRNEAEVIWVWVAQNKHDVCGYYWVLHYLKEFEGRVFILFLNNLPFINEKGNIFYPQWLYQIQPSEFLKAKKLARTITPSEFEMDVDEFAKLASENKEIRLLEGGKKIVQADVNFYDAELRKFTTPEWQKASKIINNFLGKAKETTGDAFILWRLKTMVALGQLEANGELKNAKDFELKIH